MNVTYEVDSFSLTDNYSDYLDYSINNFTIPGYKPHKKPGDKDQCCNKCDCKKNNKKLIEKLKKEVIKEVLTKIIDKDVDINKIVNAVIYKTKPHEDKQTSNINKNKKDIIDLNNITIWDKDTDF